MAIEAVRYLRTGVSASPSKKSTASPGLPSTRGSWTALTRSGCPVHKWWLTRTARAIAGPDPDVTRLALALHQAAAQRRVALTSHSDAMRRAAFAANELEATFTQMQKDGRLKSFNAAYAQLI